MREALLCAVLGIIGENFGGDVYNPEEPTDTEPYEEIKFDPNKQSEPSQSEPSQEYVMRIKNGVTIDHIPAGRGIQIYQRLPRTGNERVLADGIDSKKLGKKDLIKLVGYDLTPDELTTIGIICPGATVTTIRDSRPVRKLRARLPALIEGLLECQNNNCISRDEDERVPGVFTREKDGVSCHYCDTSHKYDDGSLTLK